MNERNLETLCRAYCTCGRTGNAIALLEKATVRLEILLGRMQACAEGDAEDPATGNHAVSLLEVPGWIEEQREFLKRYQP